MRVLYSWEWGAGAGHLRRFAPLAKHLIQRGHEVIVVARDLAPLQRMQRTIGWIPIAAPVQMMPPQRPIAQPEHLQELVWNLGWDSPDAIESQILGWKGIFKLLSPDVLLADFGLASLAVAHSLDVPAYRIGTGYTCVPTGSQPPSLPQLSQSPVGALPPDQLQELVSRKQASQQILGWLHQSLANVGLRPDCSWSTLLTSEHQTLLATVGPLDPYASYRAELKGTEYLGWWGAQTGIEPRWHGNDAIGIATPGAHAGAKRVVAYLKPFSMLPALLDELVRRRIQVALVGDGIHFAANDPRWNGMVSIQSQMIDWKAAARQCDFVVCNANHGTTAACLSLGLPLLAVPLFLEQRITAAAIEQQNWGVAVDPRQPATFGMAIDQLLSGPQYREGAIRFAQQYDEWSQGSLDRAKRRLDTWI